MAYLEFCFPRLNRLHAEKLVNFLWIFFFVFTQQLDLNTYKFLIDELMSKKVLSELSAICLPKKAIICCPKYYLEQLPPLNTPLIFMENVIFLN